MVCQIHPPIFLLYNLIHFGWLISTLVFFFLSNLLHFSSGLACKKEESKQTDLVSIHSTAVNVILSLTVFCSLWVPRPFINNSLSALKQRPYNLFDWTVPVHQIPLVARCLKREIEVNQLSTHNL